MVPPHIGHTLSKVWVICVLVSLVFVFFWRFQHSPIVKTLNLNVWTLLIFLHDSSLFVIDMHQHHLTTFTFMLSPHSYDGFNWEMYWHNFKRRGDKSRSSCCKAWLPESRWRGFYSISPAHPVSHLDRGSASLLTISTSSWPPIHPCCKLRTIQASLYQFISPIGSASCVTQWFLIVKPSTHWEPRPTARTTFTVPCQGWVLLFIIILRVIW